MDRDAQRCNGIENDLLTKGHEVFQEEEAQCRCLNSVTHTAYGDDFFYGQL
jgi:hypothetical protein